MMFDDTWSDGSSMMMIYDGYPCTVKCLHLVVTSVNAYLNETTRRIGKEMTVFQYGYIDIDTLMCLHFHVYIIMFTLSCLQCYVYIWKVWILFRLSVLFTLD